MLGRLRGSHALFASAIYFLSTYSGFAGDLDRVLFTPEGRLIDTTNFEAEDAHIALPPKVGANCPVEFPNQPCIKYKIVGPASHANPATAASIEQAFARWTNTQFENHPSSNVKYVANGISFEGGGPTYRYVRDGHGVVTNEIALDSFQNQIIEGDFLISFNPPPEFEYNNGEITKILRYIVPDLEHHTAETKWGGIFFRPDYQPGQQYNLQAIAMRDIGRLLGLAPSNLSNSAVYPIRPNTNQIVIPNSDDALWLATIYPTGNFLQTMGMLTGKILSGVDASPWNGGIIELLPASRLNEFAENPNRNFFTTATYARGGGEFEFKAVPPGDYLVMAEPLPLDRLSLNLFDDWLKFFSNTQFFQPEFYDGAHRESNHEPIFSFTPQAIFYAATVSVVAAETTTGVTVVLNNADPAVPNIEASGSSNERLSTVQPPTPGKIEDTFQQQNTDEHTLSIANGCGAVTEWGEKDFILPSLIFALYLLLRSRLGRKAE